MDFSTWLNNKYIEYRGDTRATILDFAKHVGVPQSAMSKWMGKNGEKPGRNNLAKLAQKLGPAVYDSLGLPRPDLVPIPLDALPTEFKNELSAALDEIQAAFTARNISDPDSPAAIALATSIFEQHGFKVTSAK